MYRYNSEAPAANDPIRIEQVFAEKPAGGIVVGTDYDIPESTAVYADNDKFKPIKGYRVVAAVSSGDTTIKIAKGSGIANGDVLGYGKKSVACTAVDKTNAKFDTVTVTMGVDIPVGAVLYQSGKASASAATPVGTPVYVTGNTVYANMGDQPVRLINGANLRKETACIGEDIAAMIPTINLV